MKGWNCFLAQWQKNMKQWVFCMLHLLLHLLLFRGALGSCRSWIKSGRMDPASRISNDLGKVPDVAF